MALMHAIAPAAIPIHRPTCDPLYTRNAQTTANQAGLIAVGEPTIEKALDNALTGAANVVKRTVDATTDEITSELKEALKS